MLNIIISIIGILVTILFVIGTHEAAHFMVARAVGIKVLRFSIGFGKAIWRYTDKKGTEYVLAWIPLGGYVKMLDESEGHVPNDEVNQTYNRQPFYKKSMVVLAGPLMNLLCAFLLYWLVFVIGFNSVKPIVGAVTPNSIASLAGMVPKQEILSVDGEETESWTGIIFRFIAHAGDKDMLTIGTQNLEKTATKDYQLDLSSWEFDPLKPDLLGSLGITPYTPTVPLVIGMIGADSPAATSPLRLGDKLIAINNSKIKDWEDLVTTINKNPGKQVILRVERNTKMMDLPVTFGAKRTWLGQKYGYLGVGPKFDWPKDLIKKVQYNPLAAIPHAWQQVVDFSYFNLIMFGKMITGKLSLQSLGGPITIFESAGTALNGGFIVFLSFLAFLSLSIGIVNLLPVPGLDGGHILLHGIEALIRKPLPEQVINVVFRLGFLFILFILVQALVNDILRLG